MCCKHLYHHYALLMLAAFRCQQEHHCKVSISGHAPMHTAPQRVEFFHEEKKLPTQSWVTTLQSRTFLAMVLFDFDFLFLLGTSITIGEKLVFYLLEVKILT